jgi:Apea-like HEPN
VSEPPEKLYVPICGVRLDSSLENSNAVRLTSKINFNNLARPKKEFFKHSFYLPDQAEAARNSALNAEFELELELKNNVAPFFECRSVISLITIRCLANAHAPFWSNYSINNWHLIPDNKIHTDQFDFVPIGMLHFESDIRRDDLEWIRDNFDSFSKLFENKRFKIAIQALNSFSRVPFVDFSILSSWIGLESLFNINSEISFRLSYLIMNYIFNGRNYKDFLKIKKSYDFRSKIAHVGDTNDRDSQSEAIFVFNLLCRCLRKTIELGELPSERNILFE